MRITRLNLLEIYNLKYKKLFSFILKKSTKLDQKVKELNLILFETIKSKINIEKEKGENLKNNEITIKVNF